MQTALLDSIVNSTPSLDTFWRESAIRSLSNLYFPKILFLFWLPALRLQETELSFGQSQAQCHQHSMQLPTRGLYQAVFQALSHSQARSQQICPELWVRALCSLIGCFSYSASPLTSFRYTTTVLEKPTLKHMSPRTRGPSRGLSGIPDTPTAFTFKSSKSRGGPQTEQEQEGSVNVKGNPKNRPLPSNQRAMEF